ncbi:MAG: hypothetical protein AAF675_21450, partial [Pseudomonadota bacterium]
MADRLAMDLPASDPIASGDRMRRGCDRQNQCQNGLLSDCTGARWLLAISEGDAERLSGVLDRSTQNGDLGGTSSR